MSLSLRVMAAISLGLMTMLPASATASRPLAMDDVLDIISVENAAPSPDGELTAVVMSRPAREGEIFGRTSYEVDPSRNDIWLFSPKTGKGRNLTDGHATRSGSWCPIWSPDGRRLAYLSTANEGNEPPGGDNVRLYVWDRASDRISRLSDSGVVTQTRYGSPMYSLDLRDGRKGSTLPATCRQYEENAPFVWLDNDRLIVLALPSGQASAFIDEYRRPSESAAAAQRNIETGSLSTATEVAGGGGSQSPAALPAVQIQLMTPSSDRPPETIASLRTYPFAGTLSLSLSPDGRSIAVMAPVGKIPPRQLEHSMPGSDEWLARKRLGVVSLNSGAEIRWMDMHPEMGAPFDLLGWSDDSSTMIFLARLSEAAQDSQVFLADVTDLTIKAAAGIRLAAPSVNGYSAEPSVMWLPGGQMLVRGSAHDGSDLEWWFVPARDQGTPMAVNLPLDADVFRDQDGGVAAIAEGTILKFDAEGRTFRPVAELAPALSNARLIWPGDPQARTGSIVVATAVNDRQMLYRLDTQGRNLAPAIELPVTATLLTVGENGATWLQPSGTSQELFSSSFVGHSARRLKTLNSHMNDVAWGKTGIFEYESSAGSGLKAAVIYPSGYVAGRRYPTLLWVYGGYSVSGPDDYWLGKYLPGLYNLYLYAAAGYLVVIPSIPFADDSVPHLRQIPDSALAALDKAIALGLADGDRVGVMGQSYGGYSVNALIAQTDRFKAALSVAGLSDMAAFHLQFDPTARNYNGIEHEKSNNGMIAQSVFGLKEPPYVDRAKYDLESPLTYASDINTPLLLVHGELDRRGSLQQSEALFMALHDQGKEVQMLRYWGENHSISRSPANVRDVFSRVMDWFGRHLGGLEEPGQSEAPCSEKSSQNRCKP